MADKKRLIDANAVVEDFRSRYDSAFMQMVTRDNKEFWNGICAGVNGCLNRLNKAPTVDAVEVVRCKDCNKSNRSHLFGSGWRFCMNNSQHHKDDHFCSYGERKEKRE